MPAKAPHLDSSLSADERAELLLRQMTLEEKVAQLGSVPSAWILAKFRFSPRKAGGHLKHGIGQITRIGGLRGIRLEQASKAVADVQAYLARRTRLGIPAVVHEECLSGFMAQGAPTFPQAIGLASSWSPELVGEIASYIRRHIRLIGSTHGLSPVLDVLRDPRWGRTEETMGEDPYLVARMTTAYIRGLQGDDTRTGVAATAKHFAAHGFPEGGRNIAAVHVGPREYREVFLFPFEAAIKEAKALSLMNAYHELDGVPAAADRGLLTGILREEWGFKGYIVADYGSVRRLEYLHKVAADRKQAGIMALEAGIDIELPHIDCYGDLLVEAAREGAISEATIDTSALRVLRGKFLLGLFDSRHRHNSRTFPAKVDTPAMRAAARRAAQQSMVLLTNERGLPLRKDLKAIAVVGPNADNARNIFGDYAYTAHVYEENDLKAVTVLQGIRSKVRGGARVHYAQGCALNGPDKSGIKAAVEAAKKSDVVIAALGERSGLRALDLVGENRDRPSLALPGVQEDLLAALLDTKKPVVVVLLSGRPLTFPRLMKRCAAILQAWFPGEEAGNAIADLLFGDANPSGKLPLSIPRDVGHIPVNYNRKPASFWAYTGTEEAPPEQFEAKAILPFGHGLSYTKFRYSALSIKPRKCGPAGKIAIQCRVANAGRVTGDEIVQLYIRDVVASVSRPVKELKGFCRVSLEPGEQKTVTFGLWLDQLAFHDPHMRFVVEPGMFEVMIGASSEDIRLEGGFEVTGQPKVIVSERHFFGEAKAG